MAPLVTSKSNRRKFEYGMSDLVVNRSQDDSNFERDAAIGGVAATGLAGATYAATRDDGNDADRGLQRENNGDDVSQATYTARSYPLTSSAAHTSTPEEPQVDSSLDKREAGEESSTARDTSLAGAGTIIGAGAIGAGALASQEDKTKDPEVEQATYTDRAYPVGPSSGTQEGISPADAKKEEMQPENVGSASELTGHMPGEFPTESGDDPHVPGGFPADSTEEGKPSVGSGAAIASAMGLGVGGAAAGGAYAASKSDDTTSSEAPKATESDLHPGGQGFPYESSQTTESTSESNLGRNTAIAGGTAAAVAGAGGLTYAATRGDDKPAEVTPTQKIEDSSAAPISSTTESKPADTTTRSIDQKPTAAAANTTEAKPEEEESNFGSNAAIAGGATAAAGAGAGTAYYATRDDEPEQTEEKKGFMDKLKEKKQERDQKKEEENAEKERQKEQEKAAKEDDSNVGRDAAIAGTGAAAAGGAAYYATRDDGDAEKAAKEREEAEKQRAKEQEKADKERQKENEKAEKERQKEHEKQRKEAEKEREKEQKKHEKEMTKEEKKEEERQKREAWEKENAARLAAYQKGELGPGDVMKDGQEQQPIADKSTEEAVAGGVVATGVVGGGAATYAATRGDEQPTGSSSDHKTSTDDQGHTLLHKKNSDETGEKKPSLIQKILHPNKTRRASQDQSRASQEATRSSQESTPHKGQVGTDGPIGDPNKVSGMESTSRDATPTTTSTARDTGDEIQPVASSSSGGLRTETLAPGASAPEGYITLVHQGADPDAPHVIVKDH